MAPIPNPQVQILDDESILDWNWYYNCLLSTRKDNGSDAASSKLGLGDGGEGRLGSVNGAHFSPNNVNGQHSILQKEPRKYQERREEGGTGTSSPPVCFGSSHFGLSKKIEDGEGEWLPSMFAVLDEDGDGRLTPHEIVRYLERLGLEMPEEEVELAVRSVSACGDGFLTATEFPELYRIIFAEKDDEANEKVVEERAICQAFSVFDQNGDGFINAMELSNVLWRLGFEEGRDVDCCHSMIKSVDFNGDGLVDIDEFKHLLNRSNASLLHPL